MAKNARVKAAVIEGDKEFKSMEIIAQDQRNIQVVGKDKDITIVKEPNISEVTQQVAATITKNTIIGPKAPRKQEHDMDDGMER